MANGASPTQIGRSIEPGSVPHGDRAQLEQDLKSAIPSEGGQGPSAGGSAAPSLPTPGSPIEALMTGQIPSDSLPATDGLSVGRGAQPMREDPMQSPRAQKLRAVASEATSPMLRQAARNLLRRLAGGEAI